jgi:two-component system cell cycle response regulator
MTWNNTLRQVLDSAAMPAVSQEELWSLAFTDELTGLLNRRAFMLLANQQLKLSRRTGRGALLFFSDLDRLKQINDHFGHGEGDTALIFTAQILRETFRDSDVIGRFGGDEFLILAPETSSNSEVTLLRRLREKAKSYDPKECRYTYSLSIGVARFDPRSPCLLRELISRADLALYKQKGRTVEKSVLRQQVHRTQFKET